MSFTDVTQQFLILIKGVKTDFNSFFQWYIGEKGRNVKTDHKVFRILFTYFLREFESTFNCKLIFCDGFKERN